MSKFICNRCNNGVHLHDEECTLSWTDSTCDCKHARGVFCSVCKVREATIMQSESMRQWATVERISENWVYRLRNNLPDLCKVCSDRMWSS